MFRSVCVFIKSLGLFGLCVLASPVCHSELRVAFSDLLPESFNESIIGFSISNDLGIQTTRMGSLPMIEEFLQGQFDLCILAMPDDIEMPKLDETSYNRLPLAYKSAVVAVHKDNPIRELRLDQLSSIFGSLDGQSIKNWRDLGVTGYTVGTISPFVAIEDNGIARELFRHKVLSLSYDYISSVRTLKRDAAITLMSSNENAIGIFPKDPEVEALKVLYVAKDQDSIAYGPNAENIFFGDYPIKLPFYVLYKYKDSSRLLSIISFLMSDEIEMLLSDNAFFPVPKVIRGKYSSDVEMYIHENNHQGSIEESESLLN